MVNAHTHTHTQKPFDQQSPGAARMCCAHSAVARCRPGGNALQIDYSGVISLANFRQLDRLTLPSRLGHWVALECMDKAVTLPGLVAVDRQLWPVGTPPSVVIVRDDQYDFADAFSAQLARLGIIRVVFRKAQSAMALALADRMARRRPPL